MRDLQIENSPSASVARGIHVVAKPIGPACNLDCEYCFYREKEALFAAKEQWRMSMDVLSRFISGYVAAQPAPVVDFVWQGGEPTLLGIDFFKRVVELQRRFTGLKTISNSLQTNGTLLTDKWCAFLKKNNFMVGISLDGPEDIHDRYRRDKAGKGTFRKVMNGLKLLQKHGVEYNVLSCVARETAKRPLDVYGFLKDTGVDFIQFTPVVERLVSPENQSNGLRLAGPAVLDGAGPRHEVAPWSVIPEEYGDFLIAVYEEWVRKDVGTRFIMNFEWALNAWLGEPSPVCVYAETCGRSVVMEHNGDVFACDHCVYPEYRLGNITADHLATMVEQSLQRGFGLAKESALPRWCRECDVLAACRGGCPKHRFEVTPYDEPGMQYLCKGYKKFFLHIRKYLHAMAQLLRNDLPASYVMDAMNGPLVIKMEKKDVR